jgi:hypothetical protein
VSLWLKASIMWLVLLVAMMGNGLFRGLVLEPRLGEDVARQVASLLGVCILFALTGPFVMRLGSPGSGHLLGVGLLWLVLTVAFELLLGHYVTRASWETQLADYNLLGGRLWPLVLLTTLVAPWLWGFVRRQTAAR